MSGGSQYTSRNDASEADARAYFQGVVKSSQGFRKTTTQVFKTANLNIHITDLKQRLAEAKAQIKEKDQVISEL